MQYGFNPFGSAKQGKECHKFRNQGKYGNLDNESEWVCPNDETINTGDACIICGRPRPVVEPKRCKKKDILIVLGSIIIVLFVLGKTLLAHDNHETATAHNTEPPVTVNQHVQPASQDAILLYNVPQKYSLNANSCLETMEMHHPETGKFMWLLEFSYGENERIQSISWFNASNQKVLEQQFFFENSRLSYEMVHSGSDSQRYNMATDSMVTLLDSNQNASLPASVEAIYYTDGSYLMEIHSQDWQTYFQFFFNASGQLDGIGVYTEENIRSIYTSSMKLEYFETFAYRDYEWYGNTTHFTDASGNVNEVYAYDESGDYVPEDQYRLLHSNHHIQVYGVTERIMCIRLLDNIRQDEVSSISVQLYRDSEQLPAIHVASHKIHFLGSDKGQIYIALPSETQGSVYDVTAGSLIIFGNDRSTCTVTW